MFGPPTASHAAEPDALLQPVAVFGADDRVALPARYQKLRE